MYPNLQQQNNNKKLKAIQANQEGLKVDKDSKNIAAKNVVRNFTSLIKSSSIENEIFFSAFNLILHLLFNFAFQ